MMDNQSPDQENLLTQEPPLITAPKNSFLRNPLIITLIVFVLLLSGYFALTKYNMWWPLNTSSQKPGPSSSQNISSWQTFKDDEYGFEIKIPADWTAENVQADIFFMSPQTKENVDKYRSSPPNFGYKSYDVRFSNLSIQNSAVPGSIKRVNINGIMYTFFSSKSEKFYETSQSGKIYSFRSDDEVLLNQIIYTLKFIKPISILNENKRIYRNSEFDFEFFYPNNMFAEDSGQNELRPGVKILAYFGYKDENGGFSERFAQIMIRKNRIESLDELSSKLVTQYQKLPNFVVNKTNIGGLPAISYLIRPTSAEGRFLFKKYYIKKGNDIFEIEENAAVKTLFSSPLPSADQTIFELDQVVSTIKFN